MTIDLFGIAAIITAVAGLAAVLTTSYVSIRTLKNVEEMKVSVVEIDRAVNGKDPGEDSMVKQVSEIHGKILPRHFVER